MLIFITVTTTDANIKIAMIKSGHECGSSDELLGFVSSAEACGARCINKEGCKYFIVENNGGFSGRCYWEKTTSQNCPEGWDVFNSYDFYAINGKYGGKRKYHLLLFMQNSFYDISYVAKIQSY